MRILFITQLFQPESFLKGLPFARELVDRGHEVEVLTTFPNHPQGKIFPGYHQRLLKREEMEGISVLRVPIFPSHDRSSVRRFLTYTSFALSAAAIGPWVAKQADVAYVYHPPPTVCVPACFMRLLRGVPFVYDIQDLWPDSLLESGMFNNKFGVWLAEMFCKFFYRAAKKIVVLSPGFKEELCRRGVPEDKIEVIYNWCDDTHDCPVNKDLDLAREFGLEDTFNIVYAGNMGNVQVLDSVLDAAAIIQPKYPHVRFVLIGGGSELSSLKERAQTLNLKNVLFVDRQPISKIGGFLSLADVLFVQLLNNKLFRITIPSKTQAYMFAGKPILIGVKGNAEELVTRAKAGISCEPGNSQSIAKAVIKLQAIPQSELDTMGQNGKKFYEEELSLKVGVGQFEAIFESVAKKSKNKNQRG